MIGKTGIAGKDLRFSFWPEHLFDLWVQLLNPAVILESGQFEKDVCIIWGP